MKSKFEDILEQNKGQFPLETLPEGHTERFIQKRQFRKPKKQKKKEWVWRVAASIIMLISIFGLWNWYQHQEDQQWVENAKPEELKQTELTIASKVEHECQEILRNADESDTLVRFTMLQIKDLENEYKQMEQDLVLSGNEKVIEAMEDNLALRTQILADLQEQLNK